MNYILSHPREVLELTGQHLLLVFVSTGIAALIGIPLGILLTRRPRASRWILGFANVVQTIPSLALFGFLIPLPFLGGIGARTAIIALVLYSILPIVQNTHAGIAGVDPSIREVGRGMGMTDWQLLTQVELPLATGVIMAGLRVATVIGVGVATIGAAIGAGGLGTYIFRGVAMVDNQLILAGAIPSALLALLADWGLGMIERHSIRGPAFRRKNIILVSAIAALAIILLVTSLWHKPSVRPIVVASKNFTEQNILGELLAQTIERYAGLPVDRRLYLGGTLICHGALVAREVDMYVEYTGTAFTAILKRTPVNDRREVYRQVRQAYASNYGVELQEPLGFNNTFAILIRGDVARRLSLKTLSQAAGFARQWKAGFGWEFIERKDGFTGLSEAYSLKFAAPPLIMDLGLIYRALAERRVDLIAGDSTSGQIVANDLFVLEDDLHYFPPYEAVPFVRKAVLDAHPEIRKALSRVAGKVTDDAMRLMNLAVDGQHRDAAAVVREFLDSLK